MGTALVVLGHAPVLRGVAGLLVVEERLEPGTAIVVLSGGLPFREMEAADLYRARLAPRVLLARWAPTEEKQVLRDLGIRLLEGWELSRDVLVQLGVPSSAIIVPDEEVQAHGGTLEELQTIARKVPRESGPVIIVTSRYHTRRARLTWQYTTEGRPRAIIRAASRDPLDPGRWWRERRFVLAVVREYLGLANYWLGFPVAARASH